MHVRTHFPKVTTNLPLLIQLPFGLEKQRQHELCTYFFGAKRTLVPLFSHGEQSFFWERAKKLPWCCLLHRSGKYQAGLTFSRSCNRKAITNVIKSLNGTFFSLEDAA